MNMNMNERKSHKEVINLLKLVGADRGGVYLRPAQKDITELHLRPHMQQLRRDFRPRAVPRFIPKVPRISFRSSKEVRSSWSIKIMIHRALTHININVVREDAGLWYLSKLITKYINFSVYRDLI